MAFDTKYDSLIDAWAAANGIPAALARAQNHAEDGPENSGAVSKCGAEGLFQLTPATVLDLLRNNQEVLRKVLAIPEVSVILGTFYDAELKKQVAPWFPAASDQWKATMAAYNCGPGRLHEAINACAEAHKDQTIFENVLSYLPLEMAAYCTRIWAEFSRADNAQP